MVKPSFSEVWCESFGARNEEVFVYEVYVFVDDPGQLDPIPTHLVEQTVEKHGDQPLV